MKTIIEIAKERGSKSSTKRGAWDFILKNWNVTPECGRDLNFEVKNRYNSLVREWAEYRKNKQEKLAKYILGDDFDQKIAEREKYRIEYHAAQSWDLFCKNNSVINDPAFISNVVINNYVFRYDHDEKLDYNFYSKTWHRRYGPKRTITNRRVDIYAFNSSSYHGKKLVKSIPIDRCADNVLKEAAKFFGKAKKELSTEDKKIQLKWYFETEKISENLYALKIGDKTFQFCATDAKTGATYHDQTIEKAQNGLAKKINTLKSEIQTRISIQYCKNELNFCELGIQSFLSDVCLERVKEISIAGLRKYLTRIPKTILKKYEFELNKLGVLN